MIVAVCEASDRGFTSGNNADNEKGFMMDYTEHRLYAEFYQLRNDDAVFAELYADNADDFNAWVMDYELDKDWGV